MQDVEIIGMLKSYVKKSLVGMGALKGAPCEIQSIVESPAGVFTITFKWEDTSGTTHTDTLVLHDGAAASDYSSLNNLPEINSTQIGGDHNGAYYGLVDAEPGKGLSANDFTNTLKTKLDGIETDAEKNIIEEVQLNGTALVPDADRAVDVVAITGVKKNGSALTPAAGVVNVEAIDTISVNGVAQTVTAGAVDLDVATNLITEAQWTTLQGIFD